MTSIGGCDNIIRAKIGIFFCVSNLAYMNIGVNDVRTQITLSCTDCKQRNYQTTKEKKNHPERMETKKYCRFCNKHTQHRETK